MVFSKSAELCNHRHKEVLEAFHPLERSLCCPLVLMLPRPGQPPVCPLSPTLPPSFLSLSFLDVSCLQQKPVFVFPAELEISVCFTLNRVDCLEKNFTKWKGTFKTKSRSACGLGHRVPGRRVCLCKRHSCAGDICRGG